MYSYNRLSVVKISAIMIVLLLTGMPSSLTYATNSATGGQITYANGTNNPHAGILIPIYYRVNASDNRPTALPYQVTFYNGTSRMESPLLDPSLYSRPYIGGWMTANGCQPNNYCQATEAKAKISFPNTSPSVIPSGNFLEGTMNLKGSDNKQDGLDYAIRAAHVLYNDGSHGVIADVWEACDGIYCSPGSPWARELYAYILDIYGLSASQPIYVQIIVSNGFLYWDYSYDGNSWTQFTSYQMPSTFISALYIGTTNIVSPPYYTAYFYQFGVWSQSVISGTWNVQIDAPSYFRSGAWTAVPTAESIAGQHSYFSETWTYASSAYYSVYANVPNSSPTVTFYYKSGWNLGENVCLWGC